MFILSIHRSVYFFYLPSFPTRRSSDLSLSLPDRLLVGRKGPILQITFRGESAEESVISETIDKFDVSINILHGKITYIQDRPLGTLVIEVIGGQAEVEQVIAYIRKRTNQLEVLVDEIGRA